MKKLILLLILPLFFSCEEEGFTSEDIDYSTYPFPIDFAGIGNVSNNEYGIIFSFQDYAIKPTTIGLNLDVELRGDGNRVEVNFISNPSNNFVINQDGPTVIELSGLMPSRMSDMFIYAHQAEGSVEPAYVVGQIQYAVYEGDTIENRNAQRFVVSRAGGEIRN